MKVIFPDVLAGVSSRERTGKQPPVLAFSQQGGGLAAGLSSRQAQGLRVLTFAGSRFQYAPHIRLKTEILDNLGKRHYKEDDEKAGVIEMLGRALDVNALDAILDATARSEGDATRVAAARALGLIGESLHPDAHMRVELSEEVEKLYKARKEELNRIYTLEQDMKELINKGEVPDLEQGDMWLKALAKREETEAGLYDEMAEIGAALGKLKTPQSRKLLETEFSELAGFVEKRAFIIGQLKRNIRRAEQEFRKDFLRHHPLKDRDDMTFDEIVAQLDPDKVRTLIDNMTVYQPNGKPATYKAAKQGLYLLERESGLARRTLERLMDGLRHQKDSQATNLLKQTLMFKDADLTAKSLNILGPQGQLEYETEIARYLDSQSPKVRRAALKALRYSDRPEAKRALMDYLGIDKYFDTVLSDKPTYTEFYEAFDEYVQLLLHLAKNANEYILQLNERAQGKDYDPSSRRIAMLAMSFTFDKYMKRSVNPQTHGIIRQTFQYMANNPVARDPEEATSMAVWASQLLMDTKESKGFQTAISMLSHPAYYLSEGQKERLLYGAYKSMLEDHDKVRKDDPDPDAPDMERLAPPESMLHDVLRELKETVVETRGEDASLLRHAEKLESMLTPDMLSVLDGSETDEAAVVDAHAYAYKREVPDTAYVTEIRKSLEDLRPVMLNYLQDPKDEGTLVTRILAGRILGLARDKESVDPLMELIRDPFKGKQNWNRLWSHRHGFDVPLHAWLMRYHAAIALGHIGDVKPLDLMLEMIDDPNFAYKVVGRRELATLLGGQNPIGQLAQDLNEKLALARQGLAALDEAEAKGEEGKASSEAPAQQATAETPGDQAGEISEEELAARRAETRRELEGYVAQYEAQLKRVHDKLLYLMRSPENSRVRRQKRIAAANTLMQYTGGADVVKKYIDETEDPIFKRQAASALISNDYALTPDHPDHSYVKGLLGPGLGVDKLHARGITGKGTEIAIVDGGYVYAKNEEGFQNRVKLPPNGVEETEHTHPTMVMTTAAGNGVLKGVAPESTVVSDRWPDLLTTGKGVDRFKKIIAAKLRGENNVVAINNSWGYSFHQVLMLKPLREALKEFRKVVAAAEAADINMVFSAGNSGLENGLPGLGTLGLHGVDMDKLTNEEREDLDYILDKVILVGATQTKGLDDYAQHELTEFSSIGDPANPKLKPTVVAPGADMMVYGYEKGQLTKELVNGTSFSSPFTTGLIADIAQADPRLRAADRREILKSTAISLPNLSDTLQGHGEVHPEAAVDLAKVYRKQQKEAAKAKAPDKSA